MASFNAKQLFTCENPDMVRSRMVIATMQIMQAKGAGSLHPADEYQADLDFTHPNSRH